MRTAAGALIEECRAAKRSAAAAATARAGALGVGRFDAVDSHGCSRAAEQGSFTQVQDWVFGDGSGHGDGAREPRGKSDRETTFGSVQMPPMSRTCSLAGARARMLRQVLRLRKLRSLAAVAKFTHL